MRSVRRCVETGPGQGDYRYLLEVDLGVEGPHVVVVGKNPSTAGAGRSDPTLGKIEAWVRRHGFGSVTLVNLFAVRETNPAAVMDLAYADAVGPENDVWIEEVVGVADVVVAAWGDPGDIAQATYDRRVAQLRRSRGRGSTQRYSSLPGGGRKTPPRPSAYGRNWYRAFCATAEGPMAVRPVIVSERSHRCTAPVIELSPGRQPNDAFRRTCGATSL